MHPRRMSDKKDEKRAEIGAHASGLIALQRRRWNCVDGPHTTANKQQILAVIDFLYL